MIAPRILLETRNVARSFGRDAILRNVNLTVEAGRSLSITGPSGCGKTTLLSLLALLLKPDTGRIVVDGADTETLSDRECSQLRNHFFGYIFQAAHLVGSLPVIDNVLVPAFLAGRARERRARARELLARLGLSEREKHLPHMLSLGQRRRVALARALILEPPLILADEPTNDLDPRRASQVAEFLLGLPAYGHSVVIVTHDPVLAAEADVRLRFVEGQLFADGGDDAEAITHLKDKPTTSVSAKIPSWQHVRRNLPLQP